MKWLPGVLVKIAERISNQWLLFLSLVCVVALGGLIAVLSPQDTVLTSRYPFLAAFLGFLSVVSFLGFLLGVIARIFPRPIGERTMGRASLEQDQIMLDIINTLVPAKYDSVLAKLFRDPVDINSFPAMTRAQVFSQIRSTGRLDKLKAIIKTDQELSDGPRIKELIDKLT